MKKYLVLLATASIFTFGANVATAAERTFTHILSSVKIFVGGSSGAPDAGVNGVTEIRFQAPDIGCVGGSTYKPLSIEVGVLSTTALGRERMMALLYFAASMKLQPTIYFEEATTNAGRCYVTRVLLM